MPVMESQHFLEDIFPQNVLYAVTIRSPIAKGYLKFIQVPTLPDNYKLITARDIPGVNKLEGTSMPILADKELSYIGEPVAILVGDNRNKLQELYSRLQVICDEETPVFLNKDPNIKSEAVRNIIVGDTHEAFGSRGRIVTSSYSTGIQEHWYAEPIGAVSYYKEVTEGKKKNAEASSFSKLVVLTATQWPNHVKRSVIKTLGIDSSGISVRPSALNIHMDGKLWYPSLVACHASLTTFITKKPVRLILTREEDFFYTPKRCSANIHIASVIDDNGNINGTEIDISVNLGAFGVNANEIIDQVCLGALGFYKYDNLRISARARCTNIPPQGPFAGFGLAQGLFAIERHVSQIADIVGEDPAAWRARHVDPRLLLPVMSSKSGITGEDLVNAVAKKSDYYRKWASHELIRQSRNTALERGDNPRGIGIAVGYQGSGLLYHGDDKGIYSVEVTLTKDGILEIKSGISTSEDYNKIWEKVAHETMSIKPDMVHIISTHTLDCGPSCSSRNITALTKLVEKCCLAIRKQRFHDPLPITVRRSIKPQSGSVRGGLWEAMDVSGFTKPGLCACVVEVSVDLVECLPVIRGVWLTIDGGKIISENRAKRSLMRAAAQAIGWAFTENIEYTNGFLPRSQYENFTIFSPVDIPPIHIDFLESDSSEPKGIGDLPSACIPAAFVQAVSQAMGYSFKSIPLKRKDIWEMLRQKSIVRQDIK